LLVENGATVTWVGTPNSMEAKIVPEKFNIQFIKSSGIRNKGLVKKISFPIKLAFNTLEARSMLKKMKVDLVIGFGGFASGPICLAAKSKGIPIIIHEQNAKIGLTNRVLAKLASRICLAFDIDDLKNHFNEKQLKKTKIVGNPVRKDIIALNKETKKFSDELKLLVLGGSQGAKVINEIIPKLIIKATAEEINIKVWHQTGALTFEQTKEDYQKVSNSNIKEISPFIENISEAYKWADLVVCRAGALTVSESAIAGVPAIYIPLPIAADNHQFFNAQNIVKHNAGFCLEQSEMNVNNLFDIIHPLIKDTDKLTTLSNNAKKALKNDASEQILNNIYEVLKQKS
jgi:UDP-N-acetylglucosamine--N-acetylmuramyl-(pentapeptide) pyrophosphoryl-undecaprenol N-acetylglucosamine transferase